MKSNSKKDRLILSAVILAVLSLSKSQYIAGCQRYNSDNQCVECSYFYILKRAVNEQLLSSEGQQQPWKIATKCEMVNPLCKTYNKSSGNCQSCYRGYSLTENGDCLISSLKRTQQKFSQQIEQIKPIQGCLKTNQLNQCEKCAGGFILNARKTCSQVNTQCRTYNLQNGACKSCYLGYFLNENKKCQKQINFCQQYEYNDVENSYKCSSCIQGYNLVQGSCRVKDMNCRHFISGLCVQCKYDYTFNIQGQCSLLSYQCEESDQKGRCITCKPGDQLVIDRCVKSPNYSISKEVSHCLRYQSNGLRCSLCQFGYDLAEPQRTQCKKNIERYDPFCDRFDSTGKCQQCSSGYYLTKDEKCNIRNLLCKEFSQQNGNCKSCYAGFLLQEGQCKVRFNYTCLKWQGNQCQKCRKGYYLSKDSRCIQIGA